MHRIHWLTGVAGAMLVAATSHASASTVTYDFENQPIGTETPFTLTAGGIAATFAGPPDVDPGTFGISSNFPSPTGYQYRLLDGDFLTIGSAFGASGSDLTITFSVPISSVAFTFALDDPQNATTLSLLTGGGAQASASGALTSGYRYPEGTFAYSGSPFTVLTLHSDAIDFQIDDLKATTATVPEPGTSALWGLGLVSFATLRQRRRSATPPRSA